MANIFIGPWSTGLGPQLEGLVGLQSPKAFNDASTCDVVRVFEPFLHFRNLTHQSGLARAKHVQKTLGKNIPLPYYTSLRLCSTVVYLAVYWLADIMVTRSGPFKFN